MSRSSESPPAAAERPGEAKARRVNSIPRVAAALIALVALAAVVALVARPKAIDPDQLWDMAQAALQADRLDEAASLLDRLTETREPLARDWMLRAQVAVAQMRIDDAVDAIKKIPDEDPIAGQAWLMLGQLELRRNRARVAEAALRKAVKLDPSLAQAHRELIFILGMQLRRNELNQEFTALSKLTELTYDNVFHWCLLRNCTWEPGEVAETLSTFLEADPSDRHSRLALADNYRQLGLYDEADRTLSGLPEDDKEALLIRIMLAMDRHHEEHAEELLAKGPADDPDLARIRGRIALARRDGPDALRWYRIAYGHDPGDRDTLFGLINAYELCGDDAAAAPLRRDAKNLETFNTLMQRVAAFGGRNDVKLMKEMGAICTSLGFIPEARSWYKLAIARDPLDADSQQALYRLNERTRSDRPRAEGTALPAPGTP
jgi:tetratricopeptide (TPR) repeat protein